MIHSPQPTSLRCPVVTLCSGQAVQGRLPPDTAVCVVSEVHRVSYLASLSTASRMEGPSQGARFSPAMALPLHTGVVFTQQHPGGTAALCKFTTLTTEDPSPQHGHHLNH